MSGWEDSKQPRLKLPRLVKPPREFPTRGHCCEWMQGALEISLRLFTLVMPFQLH